MTEYRDWDAADYLETTEDMIAYLDAALEASDIELLKATLDDAARASGLAPGSIYKALSPEENPAFTTVASVLHAFGLRLSIVPERPRAECT